MLGSSEAIDLSTLAEAGVEFPREWKTVRLGDIARVRYGKAKPNTTGNIPVIGSGGIYAHTQTALVDYPTLVVGRKGTAGEVWLADSPCWPSDTTFYLEWNREAQLHFIFYFLRLNKPSGEHAKTTLPSLQRADVEGIVVPQPSVDEQRRIAWVLSTIQRAIEAQEKVIAAARELKRSLMKHLFTYGPVPITETARVSLKETEIGPLPEHWEVFPLEKCALVQTGVAKGRRFKGGERTISVPYLRVANVQLGYLDLSEIKQIQIRENELSRYSLQGGDVLLTEGGDFDKLGRGFIWHGQIQPCVHQNHIFAVRVNRKLLSPEYFSYLVQSWYGRAYFLRVAHRTTHLACINTAKLKAFPVPIPPRAEQDAATSQATAIDEKIEAEEKRKTALQALFKTMLHHLMTGKIRVPGAGTSEK
jgi:type I restriction enzyme S subunit